jgi:outer membrane cobalamin receptor
LEGVEVRKGVILASLVLLSPAGALAQDPTTREAPKPAATTPETKIRIEDEVTVTASPIVEGMRVEPLAGAVTSVGREQIEDLSAQDIAAALRRVPGVVISRYNPVGSYGGGEGGGVFIRGMGAGRPGAEISTMVDGVPKFVGVWTHPLLDTLSVDMLERVDVYKGAQPVLFGNMSFAGINLVPRRRTTEGIGGHFSAAYGRFETSLLTADTQGKHGRIDYSLALSQRQSDGHRTDADGRTRAVFGRAGADLGGGWELAGLFDTTSGRADDPGVLGAPRTPVTPRFDTRDALAALTLSRQHGTKTGFVKLSRDDGSIDWLQWNAKSGEAFRTLTDWTNWNAKVQDTFGVLERGEVTFGLELQSYGGESREQYVAAAKPLGESRFQNRAAYAAFSHTWGDRVRITPSAGLRYNDSREFGGDWGGQAGLLVVGSFGEAHVRLARAFGLPGVWAAILYQGYGRGEEWRDLAPECVNNLEVGFARRLGSQTKVEASLFSMEVEDALRFVAPPPPSPSFENVGDYRAQGVEFALTVELVRGLSVMSGGTFTRTNPDPIPFSPKATAVSGAVFDRGRWRLSADAQYVGSRYVGNLRYPGQPQCVEAYFLLNGRAVVRLTKRAHGPELFLSAENLTGADYAYRPGYPMPGRSFASGLAWAF